jgi:hypothetical protein
MTFASGLYIVNFIDSLDATQLALDLSLASHKLALYTDTKTPDFSANTGYSATNEVSGTGWAAGGVALSAAAAGGTSVTPTFTDNGSGTGVAKYTFTNAVSVATTTLTSARGMIMYADALAGDNNIFAVTFGADYSTVAGTFGITPHANGLFTIDFVP